MSTTMTNASDVVAFILSSADETDIDNVIGAVKERRKALGRIAAAAVKVGATVRLEGLSPKYLNGLAGTVKSISAGRCTVTLDKASTDTLRWAGRRYFIHPDATSYDLGGIPNQCAKVQA